MKRGVLTVLARVSDHHVELAGQREPLEVDRLDVDEVLLEGGVECVEGDLPRSPVPHCRLQLHGRALCHAADT